MPFHCDVPLPTAIQDVAEGQLIPGDIPSVGTIGGRIVHRVPFHLAALSGPPIAMHDAGLVQATPVAGTVRPADPPSGRVNTVVGLDITVQSDPSQRSARRMS